MKIIVLSVGGSESPLISSLRAHRPDRVLFVASEAGGAPGSAEKIPLILEKAGIPPEKASRLLIPNPDDPEQILLLLREEVRKLTAEHKGAELLFDYTGGTKSMSAALLQCALATPDARLQFMTGKRSNLEKVEDGTERPTPIPIDWLLAERTEGRLRAAWRAYAYGECAKDAARLYDNLESDEKAPPEARERLRDWTESAKAFDAWDRFDHASAHKSLARLAERHADLLPYADLAGRLKEEEGLRILDLWFNAERRAAQGRYDDAAARCYRLIEWTAQWHLRKTHGVDTSHMDWGHPELTEDVIAKADLQQQKGKRTLSGLWQTLALITALEPEGAFARFLRQPSGYKDKDMGKRLKDILEKRNLSILAHGSKPLSEEDWGKFRNYTEKYVDHLLKPLLKAAELPAHLVRQLPTEPPGG